VVKRRLKDKWKAKEWYKVLAPKMFGEVNAGETVTDDPANLIGRRIELGLDEVTGKLIRGSNLKLLLVVKEVGQNTAYTKFKGHKMDNGYLRSLARKGISKVDSKVEVLTKDGQELSVKSSSFTLRKASGTQKKLIRKIMQETIAKRASSLELGKLVQEIILGKLSSEIYKAAKKVYPLRRVEITKTEVK